MRLSFLLEKNPGEFNLHFCSSDVHNTSSVISINAMDLTIWNADANNRICSQDIELEVNQLIGGAELNDDYTFIAVFTLYTPNKVSLN